MYGGWRVIWSSTLTWYRSRYKFKSTTMQSVCGSQRHHKSCINNWANSKCLNKYRRWFWASPWMYFTPFFYRSQSQSCRDNSINLVNAFTHSRRLWLFLTWPFFTVLVALVPSQLADLILTYKNTSSFFSSKSTRIVLRVVESHGCRIKFIVSIHSFPPRM